MNISGIRPFTGFYDYNTIKTAAQKNEPVEAAKEELAAAETKTPAVAERTEDTAKKQTFGAFDYAQLYRPEAAAERKTVDSDIKSLDMEKAISDMRKDQVLQQYQFFVGTKNQAAAVSENFDL